MRTALRTHCGRRTIPRAAGKATRWWSSQQDTTIKTRLPVGHIHSEGMHIIERFHRRDFGHMDMEVTVDDPVTLTKPVTVKFTENLDPE